jgi:hypothetical protein
MIRSGSTSVVEAIHISALDIFERKKKKFETVAKNLGQQKAAKI